MKKSLFKTWFMAIAIISSCFNLIAQNDPQPTEFNGYYRLQTQFRGDGECLEGNEAGSTVKGGAAFMNKCGNFSGQLWKIESAGNGYYRLKTQFRGEDECLEGNEAGSTVKGGAAFMNKCGNFSGQLWKITGAIRVKSAIWGLAHQTADVSAKVQGFADSKAKFRAHIVDLGSNPTNRTPKILTMIYVQGGQEITKTLKEGEYFTF